MHIRLYLLIGIILSLAGCTLPGTQIETEKQEGTIVYAGTGFSMSIPSNWNTSSEREHISPKIGKVIFKAISPDSKYGFSNNILIMKDSLGSPLTSKRYSEINQIQTSKNYLEYAKISNEAIIFDDDDESFITVFEAKYNNTTARMKFIQTGKVCGTNVYLLHAALSMEKDAKGFIKLFKSFRCN